MKSPILVLFLCAAAATPVVAPSASQAGLMHNATTTPSSAYLDYADLFPHVGWVGRLHESGLTEINGSGVLIDPHWVLTAAHVVLEVNNDPSSLFDVYRAGFTDNFFEGPGENLFASAVYVNPDYEDILDGPDLALLYFDDAFTIDPVALYAGPHVVGTPYDLVGFGRAGTPSTGASTDGRRRAGTNRLTDVDHPAYEGYLRATFPAPGNPNFMPLGMLAMPGDSGGGWFIDVNGEKHLAGITSFQSVGAIAGYGDLSGATHFSPATLTWIYETMDLHAVPEPSSLILLVIGAAAAARSKRGFLQTLSIEID